MQNDLDEFFAVADFVNPGLLGDIKSFRSRYFGRLYRLTWQRIGQLDGTVRMRYRTRPILHGLVCGTRTRALERRGGPLSKLVWLL